MLGRRRLLGGLCRTTPSHWARCARELSGVARPHSNRGRASRHGHVPDTELSGLGSQRAAYFAAAARGDVQPSESTEKGVGRKRLGASRWWGAGAGWSGFFYCVSMYAGYLRWMMEVDLKTLTPLSFACVVCFVAAGCSSPPGAPSETVLLSPSDSNVSEMIEALVSKYPPRVLDGEWGDVGSIFGRGDRPMTPEDEDALRVLRVREKLRGLGLPAFGALITSVDDERYSYSAVFSASRNLSVGDACFMIVESQVDFYGTGYKARDGADGKPSYLRHLRERKRLGQWWVDRRGRPLRELQVESLEWTIAQERLLGFVDDEQRVRILKPLEERLAELKKQSF